MTLTEALAVKARGLTKEQIIAHLRGVAENNLRADIRTIERAWKEKPSGLEGKTVKQSRNTGTVPFDRLSAVDCRNEQDRGATIQIFRSLVNVLLRVVGPVSCQ